MSQSAQFVDTSYDRIDQKIAGRDSAYDGYPFIHHAHTPFSDEPNCQQVTVMLSLQNSGGKSVLVVVFVHWDGGLNDDRPRIHIRTYEMYCTASQPYSVL